MLLRRARMPRQKSKTLHLRPVYGVVLNSGGAIIGLLDKHYI
jgi:hypothetical protein